MELFSVSLGNDIYSVDCIMFIFLALCLLKACVIKCGTIACRLGMQHLKCFKINFQWYYVTWTIDILNMVTLMRHIPHSVAIVFFFNRQLEKQL
jgi:hypothetical protein